MIEKMLIGGFFFIAGLILRLFPPKRINNIYGYRTPKSKKNMENWKLANKYSSILLMIFGLLLLLIGIIFDNTILTLIFAIIFIIILFIFIEKILT